MDIMFSIRTVATTAIPGMKAGTSGLRKRVTEASQPNYVENFFQSVLTVYSEKEDLVGSTLVVGGDGRYFNKQAIQTVFKIAAGNKIGRIWVGENGILSTPSVSIIIREREGGIAKGGLILTASHNPGGPDGDFGMKFNGSNGSSAVEEVTNKIYDHSLQITEYKQVDLPEIDISTKGVQKFDIEGQEFTVEVISSTEDYISKMRSLFNFDDIKRLISRNDFSLVYDCMHGVAGPYVREIFNQIFEVPLGSLLNSVPLEDFGGGHPDPNLIYAHDLVKIMGVNKTHGIYPTFGAANDGDADRNMILGKQFFVIPSDSIAVIAANASDIPCFGGAIKGAARSMATSLALNSVGNKIGFPVHETPTGWKFFGNLMDAGFINLCGEESFGTGSDHCREKDGIWAVLCWLSILAKKNEGREELVGVKDVLEEHWRNFGRNYYIRHDYESCDDDRAKAFMKAVEGKIEGFEGQADNFAYHDPVDHSESKNQGLRFIKGNWRVVFRISGTGSVGSTVRIYFEKHETELIHQENESALDDVVAWTREFFNVHEMLDRQKPDVIT
jgi:phosphoglucomutase